MVARSSGLTVRTSTTSTSMPAGSSILAAAMAYQTMSPEAMMVTSLPWRLTSHCSSGRT